MQTIDEVVEAVKEHWVLSGVEVGTADEMADELADHLRLAETDGKSVDAVVGGDLRRFADDWARPVPRRTFANRLLDVLMVAAAAFSFLLGMDAIFGSGGPVRVDPIMLGVALAVISPTILVDMGPWASRLRSSTTLRSRAFVPIAGIVICVLAWVGGSAVNNSFEDPYSFTVPRWFAISALVLVSLVLFHVTDSWNRILSWWRNGGRTRTPLFDEVMGLFVSVVKRGR